MKEYILNLQFENWNNQLWFMNTDIQENNEIWKKALITIQEIKEEAKDEIEYEMKVINYLKQFGFIRFQK